MDDDVKIEEIEFLVEILNKHPKESLRKIASIEGIDYYRLKRLYDKYYGVGKHVQVNAIYDIARVGLRSYVAFLSMSKEDIPHVALKMANNPFIAYITATFGFKIGISAVLHIPKEQVSLINELLSRYSDDYEYYEVRAYPEKPKRFGEWNLSYEYALLMDILKEDARTNITEISKRLGKTRPTVSYMTKRLEKTGIIRGYLAVCDVDAYNRGFCGISEELPPDIIKKFKEHEIHVGVLKPKGYIIEWFFSSKEDIGLKILEFSKYVKKFTVHYFDYIKNLPNPYKFSLRVKKDGSGYRSILDF
jgi:DNA-binding Lrp family transcriptional regulator